MPRNLTRSMSRRLIAPVLFSITIAMIVLLQSRANLISRCMHWCRVHMGEAAFEPTSEIDRELCASAAGAYVELNSKRQCLRVA